MKILKIVNGNNKDDRFRISDFGKQNLLKSQIINLKS